MTEKIPAATADATAVNPQAPDPGREPDAHETPEQEIEVERESPEGQEQETETPDGEPAAEPAEKTEQKPKPKSRYQRRVEGLLQEVKRLTSQRDHFRTMAEKGGAPKKLDPLDFNNDADYQKALIAETARQSQTEFARSQAQIAEQQAAIIEQEIWDARVADYSSAVPDFDAVSYGADVPYSKHGLTMVRQIDKGPQIAYYLGKNKNVALRLSQMSPLETAFELGRIEQRLSGPPKKTVSSAPNPVPTVRARVAATGFRPDSDDIDGYYKWRDSQPN